MKIAITAGGESLDSPLERRFGRCTHVLMGEVDGLSEGEGLKVHANPYADQSGGVGTRLAEFIASRGARVVLTGEPGGNARRALEAAGIRTVVTGAGTVREALAEFREGKTRGTGPETPASPRERPGEGMGMGRGMGFGGGGGMGRGRGRGRGRGGGGGGGRGRS